MKKMEITFLKEKFFEAAYETEKFFHAIVADLTEVLTIAVKSKAIIINKALLRIQKNLKIPNKLFIQLKNSVKFIMQKRIKIVDTAHLKNTLSFHLSKLFQIDHKTTIIVDANLRLQKSFRYLNQMTTSNSISFHIQKFLSVVTTAALKTNLQFHMYKGMNIPHQVNILSNMTASFKKTLPQVSDTLSIVQKIGVSKASSICPSTLSLVAIGSYAHFSLYKRHPIGDKDPLRIGIMDSDMLDKLDGTMIN